MPPRPLTVNFSSDPTPQFGIPDEMRAQLVALLEQTTTFSPAEQDAYNVLQLVTRKSLIDLLNFAECGKLDLLRCLLCTPFMIEIARVMSARFTQDDLVTLGMRLCSACAVPRPPGPAPAPNPVTGTPISGPPAVVVDPPPACPPGTADGGTTLPPANSTGGQITV